MCAEPCCRFEQGYIGDPPDEEALPAAGYMGFSNVGVGALTVFTVMTESNYSDLLIYLTNANDAVTAWLFVVSLVTLSRFILVGLPIAIISNTWCVYVGISLALASRRARVFVRVTFAGLPGGARLSILLQKEKFRVSASICHREFLMMGPARQIASSTRLESVQPQLRLINRLADHVQDGCSA